MYRCPKCRVELPADARFCKNCGFNQTNARIAAMPPQLPGAQRQVPPQVPQTSQNPQGARTLQPQQSNMSQTPILPPQKPPTNGNNAPLANQGSRSAQSTQNLRNYATKDTNISSQNVPPQIEPQRKPTVNFVSRSAFTTTPPNTPRPVPEAIRQNTVYQPNTSVPETPRQMSPQNPWQMSPLLNSFDPFQWEMSEFADAPESLESIKATSKAAQHWRQSWLDRQRAEAGPATNVSRGQAVVPAPLVSMQNSLMRIRAVLRSRNKNTRGTGKNSSLYFWLPVALLAFLIGGLLLLLLSSIVSRSSATTSSTNAGMTPTLTMTTSQTTTVEAGQTFKVHGAGFKPNDAVSFYLNKKQLRAANGQLASVRSNDEGLFDTVLMVPKTQLAGEYTVQAQDIQTKQTAFLTLETSGTMTSDILKFSSSSLSFASVIGGSNPPPQNLTITNTSSDTVNWNAVAVSDNQSGWLYIANGPTNGELNEGQSDKLQVDVFTQGLTSSPGKPYTGNIIFTLSNGEQEILPVNLTITETGIELLVNPNPMIAIESSTVPGTCPDTTLTLINLSNVLINWNVQTDIFSQKYISLDGKSDETGQLGVSGSQDDTKVIKVSCSSVEPDKQYSVTVYYNEEKQVVPISVTKQ